MAPTKSDVWQYWTRYGDKKDKKAQCKTCFKVYATSNGTSNLWKHLEIHAIKRSAQAQARTAPTSTTGNVSEDEFDVDDPRDPPPMGQANTSEAEVAPVTSRASAPTPAKRHRAAVAPAPNTLEQTLQRSKSFQEGGSRSARLEDRLLFMVMKDNLCLSTPEKEGFRFFCKEAVPLWKPICRATLTLRMEQKYESLHRVVSAAMAAVKSVALTADCWTDRHTNNSFLGITCHFPVEDNMDSVVLGVTHLDASHTAVYLSQKLNEFLTDWSIDPSKVSMIVTDNAENIKLAARLTFGSDRCITCFDHTLNLIPSAAVGYKGGKKANGANIPSVMTLIQQVKDIVSFSHTSNNFADALKRIQRERGKTEGTFLRLSQDCPTRWNSTYIMIDKFITMFEIVTLAAMNFPDLKMISNAELQTLRRMRDLLSPFHLVTEEMSAEKVTAASKVIPLVHLLSTKLTQIEIPDADQASKDLKSFLQSELHRRFKDVEHNLPLAIASMLDPRFLKLYFHHPTAIANTMRKIEDFVKTEIRRKAIVAEAQATAEATARAEETDGAASAGLWGDHDTLISTRFATSNSDDPAGRARTQLRAFLDRPPVPRSANPLTVWESIKPEYPELYKLARRYLTILAVSVPSERLFSLCGRIMDDYGNRLTPTHLSQRVFLASVKTSLWEKNSF